MPIGKVHKNKERLDLDDTAPGVLDRVKCLRLGSPYPTSGKLLLRPIIPRSHQPRYFHYSQARLRSNRPHLGESWGRVATSCHSRLSCPVFSIRQAINLGCPSRSLTFLSSSLLLLCSPGKIDLWMLETPFNLTCLVFSSVRSSEPCNSEECF